MSVAKRGDFVAIESVSRITTRSPRTAAPIFTTFRCGVVASATRDGIAKTVRVDGEGKPIKIADVFGFKFAHVVSAERLNVSEAVKACSGNNFAHADELRAAVRGFLK